jgi:hypothetical protein
MSKFELLSVAEDDYESDRLTVKQEFYSPNRQALKISITSKRNLVIETWCPTNGGNQRTKIVAIDVDIEGLLQFVQDAKTFIDEEAMIEKLKGKK